MRPVQALAIVLLGCMASTATARLAIVTGGNRGIGRAVAEALATVERFEVIITSRNLAHGEEVAAEISAISDAQVTALQLDLDEPSSIEEFLYNVETKFPRIDILINNAAVMEEDWTQAAFDHCMNVNLYGSMRIMDSLIPRMRRGGRIINVSTELGKLGSMPEDYQRAILGVRSEFDFVDLVKFDPDNKEMQTLDAPAYSLSKACLNRATRIYADMLYDQHISVNSVCPGWVNTRMGGEHAPRTVEQGAASILKIAQPHGSGLQHVTGTFTRDGRKLETLAPLYMQDHYGEL